MQSDKYRSPGNRQIQTRPSDCQMEKSDFSLQRTRFHCSRVQWRRALHHCIRRFALHLVMHGLDTAARPWKPIFLKLSMHCSWANLKATWSLEVCSDWLCRLCPLYASASADPALSFYVADHFVAELLFFPIASTLLSHHWQLTVGYLVARKFHDWTCCTGGVLSRYHAGIHWAPESEPFFHRCL